jgi:dUTP pyrophosphatase
MEINEYIKELEHLKKMGLIDDSNANEIENLIKIVESLDAPTEKVETRTPIPVTTDGFKIGIKFVNTSKNPNPTWAKEGDSGFDLRANLPEGEKEVILQPFERMLIPTGLYFELPTSYELQIRPRSGHSYKTGLMAILGTVDTGYRGEVKVIMINLNTEPQKIEQGERIAQGVVTTRVSTEFGELLELKSVGELTTTERGSGGFGSTGTK